MAEWEVEFPEAEAPFEVSFDDGSNKLPDAAGRREFGSAEFSVWGTDLDALSDAIAEKAGVDSPTWPEGFRSAVEGIEIPQIYVAPSGAMYTPIYSNAVRDGNPGNKYQWSASLFRNAKNIEEVTLYGWPNIKAGSNNDIATNSSIKRLHLPDFISSGIESGSSNTYICAYCPQLVEVVLGSVGKGLVATIYNRAFDGCTNAALKITVYVIDGLSIPLSGSPWGATNATIIYRSATTGEVIEV